MRFERAASRWPPLPRWVVVLAVSYFALVAVNLRLVSGAGGRGESLCLVRRLTGIPCPGCGSTRMVLAVGRGDFLSAIRFNPLAFATLVVVSAGLIMRAVFLRRLVLFTSRRESRIISFLMVAAILANWAYVLRHL